MITYSESILSYPEDPNRDFKNEINGQRMKMREKEVVNEKIVITVGVVMLDHGL